MTAATTATAGSSQRAAGAPAPETTPASASAGSDAVTPPAEALGRVHFVGIGGVGMSCLARIYAARGLPVSGSDVRDNREVAALRALGARVHLGNAAENVGAADTVVVSTAIRDTNPEVVEARRRNLRVLHRAEALAAAMVGRRAVAVAGTHGKTTTTSMLTVALQHCGADPSFAIGGSLNESGANAHNGSGDIFIAEADESDGSFLCYSPHLAVVTNVEPDHLDHFPDAAAVDAAFVDFARRIQPGGLLVACADDAGARRMAEATRTMGITVRTYGTSPGADVQLRDLCVFGSGSRFTLVEDGRALGQVTLRVPGRHNALNAAAAYTAARALGADPELLREGLELFSGTRRRFELKGVVGGVRVYDDYAHHPTEIRATLEAAREVAGSGRLIAAFQPHRYTRTAAFEKDFGAALGGADDVVVMEVYAAGEAPMPGVSGAAVAAAVPRPPTRVVFEPSWSSVAMRLAERARPADVVLTMGAGDVTMIGPEVLELLSQGAGAAEHSASAPSPAPAPAAAATGTGVTDAGSETSRRG